MGDVSSSPAARPTLFLYALLSVLTTWVHHRLIPTATPDTMIWHQWILDGVGFYPDQYRIMTWVLAEAILRPLDALGLASTRTTFTLAHLAVHAAFTLAGVLALRAYLKLRLSDEGVLFAVLLYFAILPVTYIFYGIQPSDPANFAFFTVGLVLIERQQFWPLLVLLPFSVLNRETTLLLVPAWFAVALRRRAGFGRAVWTSAALSVAGLAVYLGLRAVIGMRPNYTEWSDPRVAIPYNLLNPWTYLLMGLFLGWQAGIVSVTWRRLDDTLKTQLVVVGVLMFAVHSAVGRLAEIRLFVPLLPLTLSAVVPWLRSEASGARDLVAAASSPSAGTTPAPPQRA